MDKTKEQLEKLREVAEASLTKTDELQKVLAQIEALMSREESQTLSCLLYTSPSPRDGLLSRMPSSA